MSRRRRAGQRRSEPAAPRSRWRRYRQSIDSFGGPMVIGALGLVIVIVVVLVVINLPTSPSDDPLLGEEIPVGPRTHVQDPSTLPMGPLPSAGGPHLVTPLPPGIYDDPVADGNAIHSMEHGMVWISYQPELLSPDQLDALKAAVSDLRNDVVLAPRPLNADAIVLTSWGRQLVMDSVDAEVIGEFVTTNRDRSPEPGLR